LILIRFESTNTMFLYLIHHVGSLGWARNTRILGIIIMNLELPDYPVLNAAEIQVCLGKIVAADGCALAFLKPNPDNYIFPRTHCSKHEFDARYMTAQMKGLMIETPVSTVLDLAYNEPLRRDNAIHMFPKGHVVDGKIHDVSHGMNSDEDIYFDIKLYRPTGRTAVTVRHAFHMMDGVVCVPSSAAQQATLRSKNNHSYFVAVRYAIPGIGHPDRNENAAYFQVREMHLAHKNPVTLRYVREEKERCCRCFWYHLCCCCSCCRCRHFVLVLLPLLHFLMASHLPLCKITMTISK
jgi:hypothetical protein